MSATHGEIARYYDTHQFYYTHFWSKTALHYGLWYGDTRTLAEAVRNTDILVSNALGIRSDDIVLDAGCGVGGTAIRIACTTGATVYGVTLSDVQRTLAERAAARSAPNRVQVTIQDFGNTDFSDRMFSKLYGIESVCYAQSKRSFMREAFRLMKGGGKLAVVDTFLANRQLNAKERRTYSRFIEGWAIPNLATQDEFRDALSDAGFIDVAYRDLQQYIWPSVRRVFYCSFLTVPLNLLKIIATRAPRNLAAFYQKAAFENDIARYGLFTARKP
jgi:cyclopropane fatty-acyl-phospholipid synthase-like methyltransferase